MPPPASSVTPYDALLLVSFGGPERPEDVLPFLENVTRGRGIPRERLSAVAEHYLHFGGASPINGINRALIERIEAAGGRALAVGAEVTAVDAASRDVIGAAGHGEHFTHGLGHGVGLEIHEAPGISALGAGTLRAGMAVTVEPGVYLPGHGGVRIEDTLVVTDDEPELLTLTSKELLVL